MANDAFPCHSCLGQKSCSWRVAQKPKFWLQKRSYSELLELFSCISQMQLENLKQLLASCPCRICCRIWHPSTFTFETGWVFSCLCSVFVGGVGISPCFHCVCVVLHEWSVLQQQNQSAGGIIWGNWSYCTESIFILMFWPGKLLIQAVQIN